MPRRRSKTRARTTTNLDRDLYSLLRQLAFTFDVTMQEMLDDVVRIHLGIPPEHIRKDEP